MPRVCLGMLLAAGLLVPLGRAAADGGDAGSEPSPMPETLPDDPPLDRTAESDQLEVLPELDGLDSPAEEESSPLPFRFEATLQAMVAVPFAGERGATALGYAITYGVGYGKLPLLFGLDFMSATSGGDTNLAVPANDSGEAFSVRQAAENKTLYFDLWLRVQPLHWAVRPYVEGFVGTKLAQARYTLLRAGDAGESAQTVSAQDWSRSLGWGAGVDLAGLLKLADALSLTLGIRRLHSAHVVLASQAEIAGQRVPARGDVASAVWQFSLGIVAWYDLGAPKSDANF